MRHLVVGLILALAPLAALAEDARLTQLMTGDDSRGWNAVGRLNMADGGFCTGTLIAQNLVLTAAHCLFDKVQGARIEAGDVEFLAGWRHGRAEAYRGVRRVLVHPAYDFDAPDRLSRVMHDVALLELDQPIRLGSIRPFATAAGPATGDAVGVVSYAQDRSEMPSLQDMCRVLGHQPGVFVLSCNVDFGSSGAPVFAMRGGVARIVSVVSAKAEVEGGKVALGVALDGPLADLMAELDGSRPAFVQGDPKVRLLPGTGGAKFVRP